MEIVIGTKNWSSWSLRPWLALKRTGAPFVETVIQLRQATASETAISAHSPSRLVPVLKDGDLTIWDSLAICEYLAENAQHNCPLLPELRVQFSKSTSLLRAARSHVFRIEI